MVLAIIAQYSCVTFTKWLILIMLADTPIISIQSVAGTLVVGSLHGGFNPIGSDGCCTSDIILAVEFLRR